MHKVLARRIMAWVLSVCMIAGAVDLTGFTVKAAVSFDSATITLEQTEYTYTGDPIIPIVTEVRDASGNVISADLYDVVCRDNTNVGMGFVRVVDKTNASNYEEQYFNITPKPVEAGWIAAIPDQTTEQYGLQVTPEITVTDPDNGELQGQLSQTSVPGMDYTYIFSNNTTGGTATVTITGQGNYTGTVSASFTIIKLEESKLDFLYTPSAPIYQNGQAIEPTPTNVRYEWGGSTGTADLVLGQDYTVEYADNHYATRQAKITVVGMGRYEGLRKTKTFVIQKNVAKNRYGARDIIISDIPDQPLAFTGNDGVLIDAEDVYVYDPDYPADNPGDPGRRLRPGIDYEVSNFQNNKAETTPQNPAQFVVHGLSGTEGSDSAYAGTRVVEFQIVAAQLSERMVTIDASKCIYDGTDQSKNVVVTVKNGNDITYTKDVDYTVEAVGNSVDAGQRQLLISAKPGGQLKGGPVTVTYNIQQRDLSEARINLVGASEFTYDGSAKTPAIEVFYNNIKLEANRDYDPRYDNNTNVSTQTVTGTVYAVGKGNFKGNSATRPFRILPFELTEQNMVIDNFSEEYTYTGREITPAVRISVEGLGILVSDRDYTVTCPNNRDVGTVTMQIVGINNFTGGITKTFQIVPRNVEDGVTINVPSSVEYTGNPVEPQITLNYNGVLESPNDYTLRFSNNTNVGEATVEITGHNNFTGTTTRTFRINGRNIDSGELVVLDEREGYDFADPEVTADQRFYKYTGSAIEPVLTVRYANAAIGMGQRTLIEGEDYEISYNNQTELGTAQVTITAQGNYAGTKTMQYTIKGDLSDHNNPTGFTKITIPTQIYSPIPVVPENVEITFNGTALNKDVDYEITCENNEAVGDRARATITGKGKYCGIANNLEFSIRPMNLSTDDLAENKYVIDKIAQSYVYWGQPIRPVPEITHHGEELEAGTDYRLDYGSDTDNVNAGKGKVVIHGATPNYGGSHDVEFDIEKYDIGADYAKDCIEVTGLVPEVMLDDVKEGEVEGVEMSASNPDAVIQTNLKVMYTPVNPVDKTEKGQPRELLPSEYSVTYEGNTTIGEATITFTGIGNNFTGTITRKFKIMGNLSKDSTSLTVEDCVYSPAAADGSSTNTPEPVVRYTITRFNGTRQVLTLEKDKDYKVSYEHNDNATVVEGQNAKVIISPVTDADGNITGSYKGTKEAEFVIEQRDLSKAVASGNVQKDPDLEVSGVAEEGYEYTGSQIVPELQVTCKGTALTKVMSGAADSEDFDYELSAANNLNVYTYEIGPTGSRERRYPTLTVEARHNEDGDYVGNYKGKFQMRFQINPRQISKETVDTVEQVVGIEPEMDYTGNPITFRKPSDDPMDTRNNIIVTWCKNTSAGQVKQLLTENEDYEIIYEDNTKIGEATVRISAVRDSNYEGTYDKHFKIMANLEVLDETDPTVRQYMTLDYNHNVPYGMVAVFPELEFKDYSGVMCQEATEPKVLEEGVDYEIVRAECKNNVNVGREDAENAAERPSVVIQGIGCYRGKITRYYNITPMDLADDQGYVTARFIGSLNSEDYENAYPYTGEPVEPRIEVYNRDQVMVPNVNYTIKGYINNTEISTPEKRAGVIIQAVEGGNYLNEKTLYFSIIPTPIEGMQVRITSGPQIFDRTEKEPEVEISYRNGTQTVTLDPKNYDVAYENNINVASRTDENPPTIVITGKGGYGGTLRETFAIEPESLAAPAEGETDDFVIKAANAIYTGEAVTTTLEVKAKDGTLLVEDQDYTVGEYRNNIEAGEATVEIRGMGNYTGMRQVSFYITPADAEIKISEIPEQEYTSKEIKPEITVTLGDTEIVLTEGQDYEAEYSDNINAGTAKVSVKGSGNFSGTAEAEFTIRPKSISTEEGGIGQDMVLGELEDQLYTGRGVTPDISLAFRRGMTAIVEDGEITETEGIDETLVLDRDYRLTFTDNVAVGTAGVAITGIGNYAGTLQSQFKILGPMNLADVPQIPVQPYTGEPATPEPDVSFAGVKLVENTDYTLEYKDNVNRGTATIIITGMGWYTGTKEVTFDIAREFSEETLIKGVASAYTYTGAAIAPVIRVEDKGMLLTNGKDYQVTYSDNINAGTATITITGMDRYRGTKTTTFKIMPQNLGRAEVEKVPNQIYDKKAKTPKPKVSSDGITLKEGTDYTIAHRANKGPGMASVVIKGKGNYTGSQTVNYKIVIPKVTGVKKTKYTETTVSFAWNRNSIVSGYEIYNAKNKRVAFIRKNKTVKATVSKLKAGTADTYRVRAYVKKDGVYYYGAFVKIKAGTAPKATKVTNIASKKSKQVALQWKKVKGATSYQVYRSDSKKGKYKKLASTKKTSYTDKKATGGKTYYYKVRVSKKSGAGTCSSGYSPVVSIKARK